jgi:O-antigen/teichoic acid export membrane protein
MNKPFSNRVVGRATSNFGWSVVSEVLAKAVTFITNIYLARVLSISGFGMLAFTQTGVAYFWLAVDLGVGMYGIREIAKHRDKVDLIIRPLLTIRLVAGVIVFLIFNSTILFLPLSMEEKLTFLGSSFYLVTYAFYTDWVFKGLEKFNFIAVGSFVFSIAYLGMTLSFVRKPEDLFFASVIPAVAYLFGGISLFFVLRYALNITFKPSLNYHEWFHHIKESVYFSVSSGLMLFYQYLPILLLRLLFSPYEVGLFSAPYRIVIAITMTGSLLTMAFFPIFSEMTGRDHDGFKAMQSKFTRLMLLLGTPIAIVGTLFGRKIVLALFGNRYADAHIIFRILIWLVPLVFLRYTYGSAILAAGFQRIHNIASLAGVGTMCLLSFFLISRYKMIGASCALVLSEAVMLCAMMFIFKRKIAAA